MTTVTCPTCCRPLPVAPTPERPEPLPDPALELTLRLVLDGAVTVPEHARRLFGVDSPSTSQREAVRRRLDAAVRRGLVERQPGRRGGPGGTEPTRYLPRLP